MAGEKSEMIIDNFWELYCEESKVGLQVEETIESTVVKFMKRLLKIQFWYFLK